jgi:hypothetical protein
LGRHDPGQGGIRRFPDGVDELACMDLHVAKPDSGRSAARHDSSGFRTQRRQRPEALAECLKGAQITAVRDLHRQTDILGRRCSSPCRSNAERHQAHRRSSRGVEPRRSDAGVPRGFSVEPRLKPRLKWNSRLGQRRWHPQSA